MDHLEHNIVRQSRQDSAARAVRSHDALSDMRAQVWQTHEMQHRAVMSHRGPGGVSAFPSIMHAHALEVAARAARQREEAQQSGSLAPAIGKDMPVSPPAPRRAFSNALVKSRPDRPMQGTTALPVPSAPSAGALAEQVQELQEEAVEHDVDVDTANQAEGAPLSTEEPSGRHADQGMHASKLSPSSLSVKSGSASKSQSSKFRSGSKDNQSSASFVSTDTKVGSSRHQLKSALKSSSDIKFGATVGVSFSSSPHRKKTTVAAYSNVCGFHPASRVASSRGLKTDCVRADPFTGTVNRSCMQGTSDTSHIYVLVRQAANENKRVPHISDMARKCNDVSIYAPLENDTLSAYGKAKLARRLAYDNHIPPCLLQGRRQLGIRSNSERVPARFAK